MKRLFLATKQVEQFCDAIPMTAASMGLLLNAARHVNEHPTDGAYEWVAVTLCGPEGPEQIRVRLSKELI
jgi:hypothetical protein